MGIPLTWGVDVREILRNLNTFTEANVIDQNGSGYGNYLLCHMG